MNLITDMKFRRGEMGMLTILILILMKGMDGLTWNTKMMASVCCQGTNQFLIWNFTKGENERVTELQWFFNKKTLVCFVSTSSGFHVAVLYKGRVERNGTTGILLKNVSLNDSGEYTLYVKLEEEKEPNVQGINLTVVEPPPNQCKPIIKKEHPQGIIYCSTSCERSPLSIEWIINATNYTGDIGPYFVVNSSGTSEQPICCLRDFKCLDDYQTKFCTPNHFSFTEDMHTVNESVADTNHMVCTPILIIVIVILTVLITVVITCVILNRRRCRLCVPQPVQVTSHRDSPDSTSYQLMWDKPDDGGPPLIKYIIRYCEVEIKPNGPEYELSKPLSQLVTVEISPLDISYTLSPLKPGSYYQVEVKAVNTMGMSSVRFIFKTKEIAVEPTHSNTVVQFNEDLQQFPSVAATTEKPSPIMETVQELDADVELDQIQDWPLQDSDQRVQNVNNISTYTDFLKSIFRSNPSLKAELQADTKDWPLQDSDQRVQNVNNISIDTNVIKSILRSNPALMAELQAGRKDWPLQDSDQRVQNVNNISIDTNVIKSILRSNPALMAELQAGRKDDTDSCETSESEVASLDWPLQDSIQRVQNVNNISIDTDFLKSMFHSNTALMAELQASRKETTKLKKQLYLEKHMRKKENRPKYSYEMTPVKCRYFKKNDTDSSETSESDDASSELVPL